MIVIQDKANKYLFTVELTYKEWTSLRWNEYYDPQSAENVFKKLIEKALGD